MEREEETLHHLLFQLWVERVEQVEPSPLKRSYPVTPHFFLLFGRLWESSALRPKAQALPTLL